MEPQGSKRRLWMKGFKPREDTIKSAGRQPTIREARRRPPIKNSGATGLGFRLSVTVCPKLDQVFLAFSTILFIVSIDLLVLTVVNVGPGLLSRKFTPTTCTIVEKYVNTSTYCYVSTIENHGTIMRFPCLQIYVTANSTSSGMSPPRPTTSTDKHIEMVQTITHSFRSKQSQGGAKDAQRSYLLYQNELHLAGGDYIHRPCSYLPSYCSGNKRDIEWQVANYSLTLGEVNASVTCHYSDSSGLPTFSNGVAMKERVVTDAEIVHTLMWPSAGIVISILCCSTFWKQNRHRVSRLFIYNSWS